MNRTSAASNDRKRSRKSGFIRLVGVGELVELFAELPCNASPFAHGDRIPEEHVELGSLFPRTKAVHLPGFPRFAPGGCVHGKNDSKNDRSAQLPTPSFVAVR